MIILSRIDNIYALCECENCGNEYKTNVTKGRINHKSHLCDLCSNPHNQPVTQELVKKFFEYNPTTGHLTWRLPTKRSKVGEHVGSLDSGYLRVRLGKTQYRVHRLIWLYQTGTFPDQVDHIDHDRSNNAWSNLREVNYTGNARNMSKSKRNTSGVVGVSFDKSRNKWRASIGVEGSLKHLGMYESKEDAVYARKQAEIREGYHSNSGALI